MGGAWARRLRPRPAGEPILCVQVRDSSSHEGSPDACPRRGSSPTQPWPLPGEGAAGGPDGYDDSDMDWGGIDTGLTPSLPPDPGSPAADCTPEPPFPRQGVPFEYPGPEEFGRPPTPPGARPAAGPLGEDGGLVVYVPAGVEDAVRRRRELGEARPLPVPELHGLHTVVRAMVARWPSVSGLRHAGHFIANTTLAWVAGFHPNEAQRANLARAALRYIHRGEDDRARIGPDLDDAACDVMLGDLMGQPPYPLSGLFLGRTSPARESTRNRRRAPFAGRRVGEAANPGPALAQVCAPEARWRARPRLLHALAITAAVLLRATCAPDAFAAAAHARCSPIAPPLPTSMLLTQPGAGGPRAGGDPLPRARSRRLPERGVPKPRAGGRWRRREPRRRAAARWFGHFPATAQAVPRRLRADEAVWGTPRRRAGPRLAGPRLSEEPHAGWRRGGRDPRCQGAARWFGHFPATAQDVPRWLSADGAVWGTPHRRAGLRLAGAAAWDGRRSRGGRRRTRMPSQRRTAWGEFAELLAVRVGEASCPGPAADAGQRTLCLAGGLGLTGGPAAAPGLLLRQGDDPRAGRSPRTPARPDGQRTLDFGSTSAAPLPSAGSPPGGGEEESPGEVRFLLAAF